MHLSHELNDEALSSFYIFRNFLSLFFSASMYTFQRTFFPLFMCAYHWKQNPRLYVYGLSDWT